MAAVLDAFASSLASILTDMVKDEVEMLLGVLGEITKLEMTLGDLSGILGDAERKRIHDTATQQWVRELKDAMYDADDILDDCQIMPRASPKSSSASCWNMMSCFRNPVMAHEIGKKIQTLNHRLLDIEKRSSRFGFISQAINSSSSYSGDKARNSSFARSRKTGSSMIRSDVVGDKIEQDTRKLVNLLVKKADVCDGSSGIVVFAITGTGGIGKITLARMVFNERMVAENFDKKIWLSVNKDADEIDVLQSVVSAFGINCNAFARNKALLEDALKQVVTQKKILLVMDDVWSEKVWNELLRAPIDDAASESRVLVTTRNVTIARGMRAHHVHQVGKLESEDAWSLLKKQVVLNESGESEINGLKDIGKKILDRCDGLPLAIKVVGGLLLKKSRTRAVWMDVFNNIAWSVTGINDDLNQAVYLSYEELSPHLKQCFLYCSLFPKDEIILSWDIVRMWIAESFVQNTTSSNLLEDLGLEYYRELVSRNLLEPIDRYYNQSACTMHDVVRSFAQFVAKEEGLSINGGQKLSGTLGNSKLRRLCLSGDAIELGALQTQVSLRTLLVFKTSMGMLKGFMDNLCCLRVLHLRDVDLVELPESVCHLKHLRYLDLTGTSIFVIPQGIGNLNFLQVINLLGCVNVSEIPESMLKLEKLRFIDFRKTKISSIPRGFGKLEDLVKLFGFPTHSGVSSDGWWSLEELGSLSKLKSLDVGGLEKASSGSVAARAKLGSKPHLIWLKLAFTNRLADNGKVEEHISEEEQKQIEDVLGNLCPPPSIEELTVSGYIGRELPQWMRMMSVFESLRRLDVLDYACCRQLPNGLGQLLFLDYLNVERAPSIECIDHCLLIPSSSSDGDAVSFPKLNFLNFEGMLGWSEWEWEEKVPAMPALEKLLIDNCKLSHLPPGLAYHARQLRVLDLRKVLHLVCVENFPSLLELWLIDNPKLERISNNPSLQEIYIKDCLGVKVLEGSPSLRTMIWRDVDAEALPDYFRGAELSKLQIECSVRLLELISSQEGAGAGCGSDFEWGKIQHVQQLKAYGFKRGGDLSEKYIAYTKEPYSFETYIHDTSDSTGEE